MLVLALCCIAHAGVRLQEAQDYVFGGYTGEFKAPPNADLNAKRAIIVTFDGRREKLVFAVATHDARLARAYLAETRPAPTQISVIYSARTPNEFAYGPELRALAAAGRLSLWQTVTREAEEHWDGAQGRIALGHLRSMLQDTETLCFLCGPHALVREISPLLEQLGIAPERVRVEEWK